MKLELHVQMNTSSYSSIPGSHMPLLLQEFDPQSVTLIRIVVTGCGETSPVNCSIADTLTATGLNEVNGEPENIPVAEEKLKPAGKSDS